MARVFEDTEVDRLLLGFDVEEDCVFRFNFHPTDEIRPSAGKVNFVARITRRAGTELTSGFQDAPCLQRPPLIMGTTS